MLVAKTDTNFKGTLTRHLVTGNRRIVNYTEHLSGLGGLTRALNRTFLPMIVSIDSATTVPGVVTSLPTGFGRVSILIGGTKLTLNARPTRDDDLSS